MKYFWTYSCLIFYSYSSGYYRFSNFQTRWTTSIASDLPHIKMFINGTFGVERWKSHAKCAKITWKKWIEGHVKDKKRIYLQKTAMQLFKSCKNCIWSRLYKQWNATVKWTFSHFIGIFPTSKNDERMSYKMQIYKLFGWKYSLAAAKSTCLSELEFICGQWRYFHYLLKATSASLFIIWISLNILCECENCTWIPVQRYQLPTMMGYQQHNFLFWLHYFVFQPQPLRQFRQVFDV